MSCLTLRYGFHDVQKAHEETAGLCLVQLVTARAVANEGLRPSKLREKQADRNTVSDTLRLSGVRILWESVGFSNLEGTLGITGYFTSWCAIFRFNFTAFMSTCMSWRKISEIPLPKFDNGGCEGLEISFKTFMSGSKMFFIDEIREM